MTIDANNYPLRPDEITTDWLEAALKSSNTMPASAGITSVARRPIGVGVGMLGLIEVITPTYSGDAGNAPKSVVVKYPTEVEGNLAVATTFNVYEREVRFCQLLGPKAGLRLPKLYFAHTTSASSFIMVMEDLSGYALGDQVEGCSVKQAEMSIIEMAKLHAAFWEKVDSDDFKFVPYHFPTVHSDAMLQGAIAGWDAMVAVFGDVISPELKSNKDKFLTTVPKMQEWIVSHPHTLVHGDWRMDNLMFGVEPDHAPMAVLDWQGTLRSKGVQDLAYLLSHNMDVTERRDNERALVAMWHSELLKNGVKNYTAEQAWDEYRRAVLYLWVYATVIAGTLDPSNERGKAFMTAMVTRSSTAIGDLDGIALLDTF